MSQTLRLVTSMFILELQRFGSMLTASQIVRESRYDRSLDENIRDFLAEIILSG